MKEVQQRKLSCSIVVQCQPIISGRASRWENDSSWVTAPGKPSKSENTEKEYRRK